MSEAKSLTSQAHGHGASALELLARRIAHLVEKLGGRRGVDGFVDRVLAGEVTGWAFDPTKPHRRVHIVARCDGKIVAEALADLPRKDLAQSGKGDGRHGFNLRLPANLFDGAARKVRVEIGGGPVRRLLKGGAITVAAKRPAAAPPPPARPTPSHGELESIVQGVLNGWAAHPRNGGAAAVVDVYDDERYLGSITADRPRPGLREAGAPSGALGFQFRLPPAVDATGIGRIRARIAGTRIDLRRCASFPGDAAIGAQAGGRNPDPAIPSHPPAPAPAADRRPEPALPARRQVALLVTGDADEALMRRSTKTWAVQSWPNLAIGAISATVVTEGEHRFGPADEDRLRAFAAEAHTLVLARADEDLDAALARAVAVGRPLCDVLTWERAASSRRDADRLAVLLGDSAAPLAVRGRVIAAYPGRLAAELAAGDTRPFELWLASNPSLRWGRLAGALSSARATQTPSLAPVAPPPAPRRISIAVWPGWSPASLDSLVALATAAPAVCDLEALVPAGAPVAEIDARLSRDGERRLTVRPVDGPASSHAGGWLRAFGEAAAGDVIVLCRAGVVLQSSPGGLEEICGWARHRLAGPVTVAITAADDDIPLAGLALRQTRLGWTTVSGFTPTLKGRARPVLAAPGAFMAVDRAKLAAAGGFDAERFPEDGADLDLCLRMRRTGHAAILIGDVAAAAAAIPVAGASLPAALALLDVDELAAAAAAYPAPSAPTRRQTPDAPA